MVASRPDELKNIELISTILHSSEFVEKQKLPPNSKGHTTFSIKISPQFDRKEGDQHPFRMVQNIELIVQAFLGEASPAASEDPIEVASFKIKYSLHYQMAEPRYVDADYLKYQWFFQSHAVLIGRGIVHDLLQNTDFSDMPLPYDIVGDVYINKDPKK